jgi:hypothetical protein
MIVLGVYPVVPKQQSKHEIYFEWWLEEAQNKGLILSWRRATSFSLTPKVTAPYVKTKDGEDIEGSIILLRAHTYCPDYVIVWNNNNMLHCDISNLGTKRPAYFISQRNALGQSITTIDVKPDKINSNQQLSFYTFPINQKHVWDLHGVYVQKTVLYPASNSTFNKSLFQQTWTPRLYVEQEVYKRTTKKWTKGSSKIKWAPVKSIKELL